MECGSLLPLWACLLAGAPGAGCKLPVQEVRCANLVSKVWSLGAARLAEDWFRRYGVRPRLVETCVDRSRFLGRSFAAANWRRLGESTGRGRLGPRTPTASRKDIGVYPLGAPARRELQVEPARPVTPCALLQSLESADGCAHELENLDLGDARRNPRAQKILAGRWNDPGATFAASFPQWADAKGADGLMEHPHARLNLQSLLAPHAEATLARMAAEPLVLLPQDTPSLNYARLLTGLETQIRRPRPRPSAWALDRTPLRG